jgi:AraC-like DNA-binding protein
VSAEAGFTYETHAPSPATAPFVDCLWTMRGRAADAVAPVTAPERILPDGRIEIVLNCGDPVWQGPAPAAHRQPAEIVVGPTVAPVLIRPTGRVEMVGIRFRHGGAHALLRGGASELTDRILSIGDVARLFPASLREQLLDTANSHRRAALVDRALARRLSATRHADGRVRRAAALIVGARGTMRVDCVAWAVGLSGRQLSRRFAAEVGVGPKLLSRLARFDGLLQLVARDCPPTLAAAAARAGYVDQSHLARDFRDFAGQPASAFFREQHVLTDLFLGSLSS